jgi:hypothetical protein
VGSVIICACALSISNVKSQAEEQQLSAIANYITSESMQLLSSNSADNFTSTARLDLPSLIGGQRYWVQLANDSSKAWAEIGFGTIVQSNEYYAYVAAEISASGTYLSGSGLALLRCYCDDDGMHLTIEEDLT